MNGSPRKRVEVCNRNWIIVCEVLPRPKAKKKKKLSRTVADCCVSQQSIEFALTI